jgi:hypothetical protein
VKGGKAITLLAAGVLLLALAFAAGEYRPPLISSSRNPKEIVIDFFAFGWHYSRYLLLENVRDWPNANRQRLLAYWHRPAWSGFKDLNEKPLFELGCWYERLSLSEPAALIFLEACRRDPENRWLLRQSVDKMLKLEQQQPLEELQRLLRDDRPAVQDAPDLEQDRPSSTDN